MDNDKYLLVLSVLDGKNFPSRNQFQLQIEAKFDGSSMLTDPIDHVSNPNFGTDLGWEVDRKGMHVLRIARTPIKIHCSAINKKSGQNEMVGYIILDSRLANFQRMKPQWFPLLNGKYTPRPELLLTLAMEYDTILQENVKPEPVTPSREKPKTPSAKTPSITNLGYETDDLRPILNDSEGYYLIGPADKCKDFFTLSVTIGFAANLEQLLPSPSILPASSRGFFFYYSLLGNDIQTDFFPDVVKADFSPERASVKLRSSVAALQAFFGQQPGVQVHLCCDDMSLGSTEIGIKDLLKRGSTEIFMKPVEIEDTYELKTSRHSQIYDALDTDRPVVGVVVALKKEEEALIGRTDPVGSNSKVKQPASGQGDGAPCSRPVTPSSRRHLQYPQSPPEKLANRLVDTMQEDTEEAVSVDCESLRSTSDDTRTSEERNKSDTNDAEVSNHDEDVQKTVGLHKFDLSIDLRTIRNLEVPFPINCFVRYSYSHFGNLAPITTHPTVEVKTSGNLVYLPNGFTAFSFAGVPAQLLAAFREHPITMEVLHRDVTTSEDRIVGRAVVNLAALVEQEKCHTINDIGKMVWRQSQSQVVAVRNSADARVAELHVFLTLDELACSPTKKDHDKIPGKPPRPVAQPSRQTTTTSPKKVFEEHKLAQAAALELEQWKEWQEQMFLQELKEKEVKHLKDLATEWTTRETERELATKRQLSEYQELENKLKVGLANVERRERQLLNSESEVQRTKDNLQAEYDRHVQDIKDASRRMKEECDHKVELERDKNRVLHDQCSKLQKQVTEITKKLESREAEFYAFKDKHSKPELKLQSDLNLLYIEKAEMERKINALTKSKVHYKQQYGRSLKELARMKQAMQNEAKAQLGKQQSELEEMKLQFLSSQQKENIRDEQQALHNLQLQIKSGSQHINCMQPSHENISSSGSAEKGSLSKIEEKVLANYMSEKEELLRTGTYDKNSPVIMELDKQMRAIISKARR